MDLSEQERAEGTLAGRLLKGGGAPL
ncbi:hypothetical protein DFAR_2980013 [Desulfarculales bacterium]